MLLQDIIKYKPRRGKPYRVESVTVALRNARLAKLVAENYYYDIGITLMGMQIAIHSASMNKKKLEALNSSFNGFLKQMEEKRIKNT